METSELEQANLSGFAIVDMMGHTTIVGAVHLVQAGTAALLRVDQLYGKGTIYVGPAAIYQVRMCDREAAEQWGAQHEPALPWTIERAVEGQAKELAQQALEETERANKLAAEYAAELRQDRAELGVLKERVRKLEGQLQKADSLLAELGHGAGKE